MGNPCGFCRGFGTFQKRQPAPCPRCKELGKLMMAGKPVPCPQCQGKGKVLGPEVPVVCSHCNGRKICQCAGPCKMRS